MIDILLKLGGLQALMLAVFLFKKRTNNNANLILAFLIVSFGVSCFFYGFNSIAFFLNYPHLIRLDWGIPLLFGPLIYLYTVSLINGESSIQKQYIHFLPYLLNLIILVPFFIKSSEEKIQILNYFTASITSGIDKYYYYNFFLRLAISIISLSYAYKSIKVVHDYRRKLLNEYSSTEKMKLDWLRILLYSYVIISFIFILVNAVTFGDRYPHFDYTVYYFLFIFIFIYMLSYKALSQPKIVILTSIDIPQSNRKRSLKKEMKPSIEAIQLQEYIQKKKPYLNGELTASELAQELKISRHQLSQILNEELGKSFYDFINEYRSEEFKERIQLPENNHLTLLGIAFDSGFNSKTTFNTIFKKTTGLTPSQYKKTLK